MSEWMELALSHGVVIRALKLAVVVGAILAVINHGDKILLGTLGAGDIAKILVTFVVPYCVSTVSSVGALLGGAAANPPGAIPPVRPPESPRSRRSRH